MKNKEISLPRIIKLYKKKGMPLKEAKKNAKNYMAGYTTAKKGSINKKTSEKWSKKKTYRKNK
tara:strand:- start:744 stop:932 length:189 start_codon:yes stop_codon:yes gene_type:complete